MKKTYAEKKEEIRSQAIRWQASFDDENTTYDQLEFSTEYFIKYGKKYGLLKEFKENGII